MSNRLWLALVTLCACGEDDQPCADSVPALLAPARVTEGGRVTIPLGDLSPASGLDVVDLPAGWDARIDWEARAAHVRLPYGIEGDYRFAVATDCAGPVDVDVIVSRLRWTQVAGDGVDGPSAREHPLLWVDETNADRVLLFGGLSYTPQPYTIVSDLWELRLASGTWNRLEASGTPPQVAAGRATTIPGESSLYLHGGFDQDEMVFQSLWRLDYASQPPTWTVAHPGGDGAPLAPLYNGFIFDAPRRRFVDLCGLTATGSLHCNVAAYDLSQASHPWQSLTTASDDRPSGRYGFAYAYDAETRRVIVFSGDTGQRAQDTWALELADDEPSWVLLAGRQDPPIGRRHPAFALDPVGHRFFVWGGTADGSVAFPGLYVLDLDRGHETWLEVEVADAPPARASGVAVYDPTGHRVLAGFGNSEAGAYRDLWALGL